MCYTSNTCCCNVLMTAAGTMLLDLVTDKLINERDLRRAAGKGHDSCFHNLNPAHCNLSITLYLYQ